MPDLPDIPPGRPARGRLAGAVLVASGLAAAGAAAAPWSSLATSDEERTFTGLTVGDGRYTVVLGLALVVVGAAALARRRMPGEGLLGLVLAALLTLIAGGDLLIGPPTLATFRGISADQIAIDPEAGLYVSLAAGILALLAALPRRGARPGSRVETRMPPPAGRPPAVRRPETPAPRHAGDHRAHRGH